MTIAVQSLLVITNHHLKVIIVSFERILYHRVFQFGDNYRQYAMSLTTNIFKHGIQYNKTRSRTKVSDFDSYVAFVSSK